MLLQDVPWQGAEKVTCASPKLDPGEIWPFFLLLEASE
jgi:hypothetical protein